MTLRADRMTQIQSKELRDWLAGAWPSSKPWIDTRELPMPAFVRRANQLLPASDSTALQIRALGELTQRSGR